MTDVAKVMVRFRSRLSGLPQDTGWYLGLGRSYFRKAKGARILVYHGICKKDHLQFNTLFLTLRAFESQLRLYKKYFNLVSLDDLYQHRLSHEKFNICLTFDDGFANNFRYVLPMLEQYQVPATFFITGIRDAGYDVLWNDVLCIAYKYGPATFKFRNDQFVKGRDLKYFSVSTGEHLADALRLTGFEEKEEMINILGSLRNNVPDDYWLQMSQEEIKKLSLSKWATIGSHSYYHNDLQKIPINSVKDDIRRSKEYLENITGKEISALAFPYGSYTRQVADEARNAGYSQVLTTEFLYPEDAEDASLKERLIVNPFISNVNQLHASITGDYS